MERSVLEKLLAQYKYTNFNPQEVEALLNGQTLPTDANTTLLDIEQSIRPKNEFLGHPIIYTQSRGAYNDNVE